MHATSSYITGPFRGRARQSLSARAQPLPRNDSSSFSPSCALYYLCLLSFPSLATVRKEYCKLLQWNEDQAEKFLEWLDKAAQLWSAQQKLGYITKNNKRLSGVSKGFGLASVSGNQYVSTCSFTIIFPTILRFYFPPQDDIINIKAEKNQPNLTLWNPSIALLQHQQTELLDVHPHEAISFTVRRG